MSIQSTWLRINKNTASLMRGGDNRYLKQIPVKHKDGIVSIATSDLFPLITNNNQFPIPGNIVFELNAADPEKYPVIIAKSQSAESKPASNSNILPRPNAKGEYITHVPVINDPQDTAVTCQSACISMATRGAVPEAEARAWLTQRGNAGDPHLMGRLLKNHLGDRYEYNGKASVNEMIQYLQWGYFLILHLFNTQSGHVICADGTDNYVESLAKAWPDYPECHSGCNVKDPWGEFDCKNLRYKSGTTFYDGYYPWYFIYASGVVPYSFFEFKETWYGAYNSSWKSVKGAYCHIIKTKNWKEIEAAAKK